MAEETAKIKEVAGFATGDRQVEAEGRAEQQAAEGSGPDEPSGEAVEQAEQEVRADHGDV